MDLKKKTAFTIAELTTVLVIMGTVLVITIPSFWLNHKKSEAKSKIRKSMAYYEAAFKKLAVDNNCMTDSCMKDTVKKQMTCDKIKRQFIVIEEEPYDNEEKQTPCIFKTVENVWWNMTEITNPHVAMKKSDLDNCEGDNICYMFFGHINKGIIRINDVGDRSLSDNDRNQLNRLYRFIGR